MPMPPHADASAVVTRDLAVLPATHGAHAGVVGCATLALEAVLSPAAIDRRLRAVAADEPAHRPG